MAKGKGSSATGSGLAPALGLHTGVFGVINCDSKDNSFYCNFTKIFSIIIKVFILCFLAYASYTFLKPYVLRKYRVFRKRK